MDSLKDTPTMSPTHRISDFTRVVVDRATPLGRGSHGTVYLGRREDTGQLVAVKETAVDDAGAMAAMKAEVAVLTRLSHTNCVGFLGMRDFCEGSSSSSGKNLLDTEGGSASSWAESPTAYSSSASPSGKKGSAARKRFRLDAGDLEDDREEDDQGESNSNSIAEKNQKPTHLHVFLEFLPGGTISNFLEHFGPVSDLLLLKSWTYQVTRGLAYLHMRGIVHRDLKGSNVLLGLHGQALISDMGTAFISGRQGKKASEETLRQFPVSGGSGGLGQTKGMLNESATVMMQTMCGSIPWMAPEVLQNQGYKKSSDVWSLGGLVIEMASGRQPWADRKFDNVIALMMRLSVGSELPTIPDWIGEKGVELVGKCCSRDAGERPVCSEILKSEWLAEVLCGGGGGGGGSGGKDLFDTKILVTSPLDPDWGGLVAAVC